MAATKTFTSTISLTTTTTTNLLNPGVTSMAGPIGITIGQPYLEIRKMRVVNRTASSIQLGLWRGATGANALGTEIGWAAAAAAGVLTQGQIVPAQAGLEVFDGYLRLDSADFLVGGASLAGLTLEVSGAVGISG